MRYSKNIDRQPGFTLVELMVVVVIIGILASIGVPKLNAFLKTAETSEADTFAARIISNMDIKSNWSDVDSPYYAYARLADGTIDTASGDSVSMLINMEIPFGHEWSYQVDFLETNGEVDSACVRADLVGGTATDYILRSKTNTDDINWQNNTYTQPYVHGIDANDTQGDCPVPAVPLP